MHVMGAGAGHRVDGERLGIPGGCDQGGGDSQKEAQQRHQMAGPGGSSARTYSTTPPSSFLSPHSADHDDHPSQCDRKWGFAASEQAARLFSS
ncbi:hypothetical protein GCM10027030_17200 [Luteococcus sediminum]